MRDFQDASGPDCGTAAATANVGAAANPLVKMLLGPFLRTAQVCDVRVLTPHFRLLTFKGDDLKNVDWQPGQKVQVLVGGFAKRTFTPMLWDARSGSTRLLGYAHGDAPGARWLAGLQVGDPCQWVGPRQSTRLNDVRRPALVFGDETSFALAYAMRFGAQDMKDVQFLFEVSSEPESTQVLQALGITNAHLIERRAGDAHVDALERWAGRYMLDAAPTAFVLTGKASSIQRLRGLLRRHRVQSTHIFSQAYWAAGKSGLD
jgi:ferric-chelate reductase (NADPH)